MAITQSERKVSVSTPLGPDKLVFRRMSANENLSQLFEYELELLSEDGEIKHESLLAKNITVTLENDDGSKRYFNGYISRFAYAETADRYYLYRATLRPWLWFLSLTADCRIFQNKKIPDIIQQVFRHQEQ